MSIKIMSQVWDDPAIKSPVEVAVMLVLADYANDEGICWPSIPTIIRKSRCCRGTVWKVINDMISRRKLSKKPGGGNSITNRYTMHLTTSQNAENQPVPAPVKAQKHRPAGTVQQVNGSGDELFDFAANGSAGEHGTVQQVNKNGSSPEPDPSGSVIRSPICVTAGKSKAFQKPETEAVNLYFAKIGLPDTEVGCFMDHYESNGWKVGKNPMKDWQSSARNWKRNYDKKRFTNSGNSRQSFDRNKGTANEGHADRYAKVPTANQ